MPLAAVFGIVAAGVILRSVATKNLKTRGNAQKIFRFAQNDKVLVLKYISTVLISAACAFCLMAAYQYANVSKIEGYIGETHTITAKVLTTTPAYTEDSVNAKLQILTVDGEKASGKTFAYSMPLCNVGDVVTFNGEGSAPKRDEYLYSNYANGIFIIYNEVDLMSAEPQKNGILSSISALQAKAGDSITTLLPRETGAVLAAMSAGDKTKLDTSTKTIFKRAGISYLLVVSGLHLSMLAAAFYFVISRIFKRRTRISSAVTCVFILFIMVFMGMSASVVRSGVALLLVYSGALFNRQSDVYTSLGTAALLLCAINPYAAVDIGLLLSISSVLAVVLVGESQTRTLQKQQDAPRVKILAIKFGYVLLVPIAATAATVPVLVAIGEGVSLVSVLAGVPTVALLPFIVVLGLVTAAFFYITPLAFIARLACLIAAVIVNFIIKLASWTANLPFAFVHLYGLSALCIFILTALLLYAGVKSGVGRVKSVFFTSLFVIILAAAYMCYDADVVHITLTGNNANPAVVITQGFDTTVIFRGSQSATGVADTLELYNRQDVNFLVDLRLAANTAALKDGFAAQNEVLAVQNVLSAKTYTPFRDIIVTVHRQNKGCYAIIGMGGFDVCVATGKVDLSNEKGIDVFIAGSSEPQNLICDKIAVYSAAPSWAESYEDKIIITDEILVRSGKSVIY